MCCLRGALVFAASSFIFHDPTTSSSAILQPNEPRRIAPRDGAARNVAALLTIRVLRSMRSDPVTLEPTDPPQKNQQSTSAAPDPAASATHALIKRAVVGAAGERAV